MLTESLNLHRELGDQQQIALSLSNIASIAQARGQATRAAQLLGAASVLLESCDSPLKMEEQVQYDAIVHAARGALEPMAWQIAWARGRTLSLEQALALAS